VTASAKQALAALPKVTKTGLLQQVDQLIYNHMKPVPNLQMPYTSGTRTSEDAQATASVYPKSLTVGNATCVTVRRPPLEQNCVVNQV
jgi:hypothetical protein